MDKDNLILKGGRAIYSIYNLYGIFLSSVCIMLFGFQPDFAALQIIDVLRWGIVIAVGVVFIKLVFESIGKALLAVVIGLIAYTLLDPSTMQQTGLEIVNFLKSGGEHVETINNSIEQVAPVVNEALTPPIE